MSKYTDTDYLDYPFFSDAENESNYSRKIVIIRKPQSCCGYFGEGRHSLDSGARVICEKVLLEKEGWRTNYLCLPCAERMIDGERL